MEKKVKFVYYFQMAKKKRVFIILPPTIIIISIGIIDCTELKATFVNPPDSWRFVRSPSHSGKETLRSRLKYPKRPPWGNKTAFGPPWKQPINALDECWVHGFSCGPDRGATTLSAPTRPTPPFSQAWIRLRDQRELSTVQNCRNQLLADGSTWAVQGSRFVDSMMFLVKSTYLIRWSSEFCGSSWKWRFSFNFCLTSIIHHLFRLSSSISSSMISSALWNGHQSPCRLVSVGI